VKTKTYILILLFLSLLNSCAQIERIDHTNGHGEGISKYNKLITRVNGKCNALLKKDINFPIEYVWQNHTDAKTSMIDGKIGVTLNLNMFKDYPDTDLDLLLSHEYFHIYQYRYLNVDSWKNPMLSMLFIEGGATLFSEIQNPGFPAWKYISYWMENDDTYNKYIKNSKESLEELKNNLYTSNDKEIDKYFSGSEEITKPWPERTGYYWGYRIMTQKFEEIGTKVFELSETEFEKVVQQVF